MPSDFCTGVPGSVGGFPCEACGIDCQLAPSSQRFLVACPRARVMCGACFSRRSPAQARIDIHAVLPDAVKEVREIHKINLARHRNN